VDKRGSIAGKNGIFKKPASEEGTISDKGRGAVKRGNVSGMRENGPSWRGKELAGEKTGLAREEIELANKLTGKRGNRPEKRGNGAGKRGSGAGKHDSGAGKSGSGASKRVSESGKESDPGRRVYTVELAK
jgi:hypothetical protein